MNRRIRKSVALGLLICSYSTLCLAEDEEFAHLRLNQIQVIGSHNSYKQALDQGLLEIVRKINSDEAKALEYSHPSLTDQLNLGLRALELDVLQDPQGGRFASPLGLSLQRTAGEEPRSYDPENLMLKPGFKVLHVQDIDFRSNCPLLRDAFRELRGWSREHPAHLPIVVTFNAKSGHSFMPGGVEAMPFDAAAFDQWDELALQELGRERMLTPDDVRGDASTLEKAILTRGWPMLESCRGKFLLVLDETGPAHETYVGGHASLSGRAMFTTTEPGHPSAAVLIINDPVASRAEIIRRVQQGYLVRTRADAGTWEARRSDTGRFQAAQESGAQVISTDYYLPDWHISPSYQVRFAKGKCERVNPVTSMDRTH